MEEALEIRDQGERDFALKCLTMGLLLQHEVTIGQSLIDFFLINPKRLAAIGESGTLIEVTQMPKANKDKKFVTKKKKGKKKKVLNKTGQRKQRQIEAMKASGYRWIILYRETLRKIMNV
jgi:hypothetical protein